MCEHYGQVKYDGEYIHHTTVKDNAMEYIRLANNRGTVDQIAVVYEFGGSDWVEVGLECTVEHGCNHTRIKGRHMLPDPIDGAVLYFDHINIKRVMTHDEFIKEVHGNITEVK